MPPSVARWEQRLSQLFGPHASMDELALDQQLKNLQAAAEAAIGLYRIPSAATVVLLNLSENATYRVQDPASSQCWALRVHREGYHSKIGIASELTWLTALRDRGAAVTPRPVRGIDGELVQVVSHPALEGPRHVVLFEWERGIEPAQNDPPVFEILGETTARMHAHAASWCRPAWFERHTWDFETSLGDRPHWGSWRNGVGLTPDNERLFAHTVAAIHRCLERFGKGLNRFGLIHGDMRLANLLLDNGTVKVIDFDDCGFGWRLYDCATTVSFFEHKPEVPKLISAWVRGYRRYLPLTDEEEFEIPTFVMLRRLVLLAWIGSHAETDLAKSMGEQYTKDTVLLCHAFFTRLSEKELG